jgi:hypothetical protein
MDLGADVDPKANAISFLKNIDWMAVHFKRPPPMPAVYSPDEFVLKQIKRKISMDDEFAAEHGEPNRGAMHAYSTSRQRLCRALFEKIGSSDCTLHEYRLKAFQVFLDNALNISGVTTKITTVWMCSLSSNTDLYEVAVGLADAYMMTIAVCERLMSDAANIMISTQADIAHGLTKLGCRRDNRDSLRVRYTYGLLNQLLALFDCATALRARNLSLPPCVEASDTFLSLLRAEVLARRCELLILRNTTESLQHRLTAAAIDCWEKALACIEQLDGAVEHIYVANALFVRLRISMHNGLYRIWQAASLQENIAADGAMGKSLFVLTYANNAFDWIDGDDSDDECQEGQSDIAQLISDFFDSLQVNMWQGLEGLEHFKTGKISPHAVFFAASAIQTAIYEWAVFVKNLVDRVYFQNAVPPNDAFPNDLDVLLVGTVPDPSLNKALQLLLQKTRATIEKAIADPIATDGNIADLVKRVDAIRLQQNAKT